ncbi:hypothetical protein BV25DRAFT_1824317 [Artomyces pyxidatus]|uniref:Uncharacterized protein n=1 Tax=Artomyces pyxidatus TaxID=48021 RepID=A0ACB8T5S7_9AGAM|nr:hypothetical protein BV25DRAFT_1824317 [Artomyces pyxidatus]
MHSSYRGYENAHITGTLPDALLVDSEGPRHAESRRHRPRACAFVLRAVCGASDVWIRRRDFSTEAGT